MSSFRNLYDLIKVQTGNYGTSQHMPVISMMFIGLNSTMKSLLKLAENAIYSALSKVLKLFCKLHPG